MFLSILSNSLSFSKCAIQCWKGTSLRIPKMCSNRKLDYWLWSNWVKRVCQILCIRLYLICLSLLHWEQLLWSQLLHHLCHSINEIGINIWMSWPNHLQGDPNQNLEFLKAITDPMLVKPKCVWEVCIYFNFSAVF